MMAPSLFSCVKKKMMASPIIFSSFIFLRDKENDGSFFIFLLRLTKKMMAPFIFLRDKENDGSILIFLYEKENDKENDGSSFIFLREKKMMTPSLFSRATKKMMALTLFSCMTKKMM